MIPERLLPSLQSAVAGVLENIQIYPLDSVTLDLARQIFELACPNNPEQIDLAMRNLLAATDGPSPQNPARFDDLPEQILQESRHMLHHLRLNNGRLEMLPYSMLSSTDLRYILAASLHRNVTITFRHDATIATLDEPYARQGRSHQ